MFVTPFKILTDNQDGFYCDKANENNIIHTTREN